MAGRRSIPLREAKIQFLSLLNCVNRSDQRNFIDSVFDELTNGPTANGGTYNPREEDNGCESPDNELLDDPAATLNNIADDIKTKVPVSAILPSERIKAPESGENADCLPDLTVHVDEFLYTEREVERLIDEGKLRRSYCKDCGSKNIEPLIYISHSMSRDALYYIFNTRLPTLKKKTVLDIGSRLGAVLYGAYMFTDASRIIGVEMNQDLCKLQEEICEKYRLDDRIEILHRKIEDEAEVVKSADVIIINNSFEFYVSQEEEIEIWHFLKRHIKSRAILVTRPHLDTTFKKLRMDLVLSEWVQPYERDEGCDAEMNIGGAMFDDSEHCDIGFYEVL